MVEDSARLAKQQQWMLLRCCSCKVRTQRPSWLPVERGVNPADCDNEALRVAAMSGHFAAMRLLLELPVERGVIPADCWNNVPLDVEIARLLLALPLQRGVNAAAANHTPCVGQPKLATCPWCDR